MKNKNGITLIALIITIIVLLILAGVSISIIVGDNGILKQAQTAKDKTDLANAQNAIETAVATLQTEYMAEKTTNVNADIADVFTVDKFNRELEKFGYVLAYTEVGQVSMFGEMSKSGTDFTTSIKSINSNDNNKYKFTLLKKSNTSVILSLFEYGDSVFAKIRNWKIIEDVNPLGLSLYDKIEFGTENFYVINILEEKVILLAEKNITTTGVLSQSDDAPQTIFSNTNYWAIDWTNGTMMDLNNYIVPKKSPVDTSNYNKYKSDGIEIEVTSIIPIAKEYGNLLGGIGRLMTKDEADALSISNSDLLYGRNTTNGFLSYWLGSSYDVYNDGLWDVFGKNSGARIGHDRFDYEVIKFGIRPVVEISKSSISN